MSTDIPGGSAFATRFGGGLVAVLQKAGWPEVMQKDAELVATRPGGARLHVRVVPAAVTVDAVNSFGEQLPEGDAAILVGLTGCLEEAMQAGERHGITTLPGWTVQAWIAEHGSELAQRRPSPRPATASGTDEGSTPKEQEPTPASGGYFPSVLQPADKPRLDFVPPPGWPVPPRGWRPDESWTPPVSWPPPPEDWVFWQAAAAS